MFKRATFNKLTRIFMGLMGALMLIGCLEQSISAVSLDNKDVYLKLNADNIGKDLEQKTLDGQVKIVDHVLKAEPSNETIIQENMMPDAKIVYKTIGEVSLRLHIFNPEGLKLSDKRPAMVFFHGGGWRGGEPSKLYPQAKYLASRGMVAISAEYRVSKRNNSTPRESVMDAKSAIRWLRIHASEFGINPAKILAGGGSAGGHLAAATATVKGFNESSDNLLISERPAALVLFNPVYDNSSKGYGYDRVKAYWQEISPMHNLSAKTPPTIVFLGSQDKHIPVATVEKYKMLMEEKGVRCDLHIYEGQKHGFFNFKHKEYYQKTITKMDQFLVSLGYLEPQ